MSFMAEIYTITLKTVKASGVSGRVFNCTVVDFGILVLLASLSLISGVVQIPNDGQARSY
jgi:hypothetical protein